jgi:hypothetical protein
MKGQPSRPVLRGGSGSNAASLPDSIIFGGTTSTKRRRKQFDQFIVGKLKTGSIEQFDQNCGKMFVNRFA